MPLAFTDEQIDGFHVTIIEELVCGIAVHGEFFDINDRTLAGPLPWPFRMPAGPVKRRVEEEIGDLPRPWPAVYCAWTREQAEELFEHVNGMQGWSLLYDGDHTVEWNMRALVKFANAQWPVTPEA